MDDRGKDARLREALAVLVHKNGGEVTVTPDDTAAATGGMGGPHGVGFDVVPGVSEYEVRLVPRERRDEPEPALDEER